MSSEPTVEASAETEPPPSVKCCPFCGELIGSYFGRTQTDGGSWCESCMLYFRVEIV